MNDTTDIKALREKYELALKDLTERLMECNRLNYCMDEITAFAAFSSTLIDQLEAERQQLDAAEKSDVFLKEELAKLANFNPDWDMLAACRESWREVVSLLKDREAELAELREKLAKPVVLPDLTSRTIQSTHPFSPFDVIIATQKADRAAIKEAGYPVQGE